MAYIREKLANHYNRDNPKKGQVMSYPTQDLGFNTVCEMPAAVCRAWLDQIGFRFEKDKPASRKLYEGTEASGWSEYCNNQWTNKMAIIVEIHPFTGTTFAVSIHDGRYWLISKIR